MVKVPLTLCAVLFIRRDLTTISTMLSVPFGFSTLKEPKKKFNLKVDYRIKKISARFHI